MKMENLQRKWKTAVDWHQMFCTVPVSASGFQDSAPVEELIDKLTVPLIVKKNKNISHVEVLK